MNINVPEHKCLTCTMYHIVHVRQVQSLGTLMLLVKHKCTWNVVAIVYLTSKISIGIEL